MQLSATSLYGWRRWDSLQTPTFLCFNLKKNTFICVYWWTRQRIHNTLIVVDRYLRLMGDKTIPDSAELRLEWFYPPFVAGIDQPHQGVVDSYIHCPSYCSWQCPRHASCEGWCPVFCRLLWLLSLLHLVCWLMSTFCLLWWLMSVSDRLW